MKISSFGTFTVRQKGRRVGRNPKTGEEVPILPRRVLVFRASQVLKERVTAARTRPDEREPCSRTCRRARRASWGSGRRNPRPRSAPSARSPTISTSPSTSCGSGRASSRKYGRSSAAAGVATTGPRTSTCCARSAACSTTRATRSRARRSCCARGAPARARATSQRRLLRQHCLDRRRPGRRREPRRPR